MKNLLFSFLLVAFLNNYAQITYVPDDNFEQTLIDLGYDFGFLDNYVLTANINSISFLSLTNKGITDLRGIEDFISLETLYCNSNSISAIDLSQNVLLSYISCGSNLLTNLDLSNNPLLTVLKISDNQLINLNLNLNTALTHLYCQNNDLTSLDLSQNIALSTLNCNYNQLNQLNLKSGHNTILLNPSLQDSNLTCIQVDDRVYSTQNWDKKYTSTAYSENCSTFSENTYVPDDNFEQTLINLGYDTVLDDYVPTAIINSITSININADNISDLTGLEEFIILNDFSCSHNLFTNLDLSNNTLLAYLQCRSGNIQSIDLSQNTKLINIFCQNNQITSLDLSQSVYLERVSCFDNQLTSLNLKNVNNSIFINLLATNNPNLECIEVGNAAYSTTNWTNIDTQTSFNEDCHYGETYVPDDNFEQKLIDFGYDTILDDYVTTANINTITSLNIAAYTISDLTGIQDFTALETLDCHFNSLTSLDVSENFNLKTLDCSSNNITTLDLSLNTALNRFLAHNNQLTSLNIKNGNNTNFFYFWASNNPDLLCIEVDNVTYSNSTWTNIDAQTSFNTNCHYDETYVPDNNFEQELINLGYDTVLDDYVITGNINTVTTINLSAKGITDLTGLEDFTALETLLCVGNSLTSIDISNNTNLLSLNCQSNSITSIDTSNNLVLDTLNCESNAITNLDFTQNTFLTTLNCSDNILTNLNVFYNTNLATLNCSNNQIGALNLITNTNLSSLDCSHNMLTGLILTNGNNTVITNTNFDATFNVSLTCIEVDDEIYSTTNWTNIDFHASFANNCHYGETYVPDNNFEQELINLGYDTTLDDYVITANINTIALLDVSFKSINDLTGIGDFMALTQLLCNNNNITNLDLGNNYNLTYLNCSFNILDDVYISSPSLNYLSASNNQLLDLDLSGKLFLTHVELQNNQLNSLNIKNGNNTIITNFNITTNPNLFCTQVDDSAYSTTNWTNKDAHTFYNTNCNYPSIWRTAHWINGVPTLTKDAIIDDAYNTGAFGSFNAYSLNINIGNQVTISPNSYIRVNTNVINNGDFIIEHEGSFLQLQDFASVGGTGNFTVKSKTTSLIDADRFTYFSSPTANENLNTFASWANTGNMWSFDTSIQDWNLESLSNNMLLAKGYAIKGQPDVGQYPFKGTTNFQGYFNNGIISVPMHFTAGAPLLDDDSTLIGNPYPSAVSASLLLNNNLNANAFYFWTHTSILGTSGYIADDYAIWNRSGGVASTSGSPAPTGYIASCQGFFVTSLATDNFIFDNSVRVTGNNDDFRTLNTQENEDKIWLNLTDDNGLFNQILLNFSEDGSYNYDATFEAKRFNSDYPIQFYSNGLNNEHFAIQALPVLLENEIIPLGCNVIDESVTNLKISIDHLENFDNVTIYLKDNLLNSIHDLKTSDYHFEVITPTNSNRFELILNRNALNLNENEFKEQIIISNLSENKIAIKSKNETIITSLKAYDVLGKLIIDVKPNLADFIIPVNLNQGTVLFLNGILKNGMVLKTKFIKL